MRSRTSFLVALLLCGCGAVGGEAAPDASRHDGALQPDGPRRLDSGADTSSAGDAERGVDAGDGSAAPDAAVGDAAHDSTVANDARDSAPDGCSSDGGDLMVDAGFFADCADDPCGSGQFCEHWTPSHDGGGGAYAFCQALPQPCTCPPTPTCACVVTWAPGLCVSPACTLENGRPVVTCREQLVGP